MKRLCSIAAALASICAAPSTTAAPLPPPPPVLQPYIHDGHFDPGDYGWLRGYYPGASASDQQAFRAINDWHNACVAASQDQMRTELRELGIPNPSLDQIPPSDPLCSGVSYPRPNQFASFAELQRAAAEARPYADSFLFALRLAEQQSQWGGTVGEQLATRVIPDQMSRRARGERPWGQAPPLSPGADAILNIRLGAAMSEVDATNTAWLKALIAKRGWPTISQAGQTAAANAWLLVQHADADPALQVKALRLMEPLLAKGEVDKSNYAYLYDRVTVNTVGTQRYGTQMTCRAGELVPRPIEDEAGLAKRRADMGLQPMADYLKLMASLPSGCPPA
jgi:hypothetical protein